MPNSKKVASQPMNEYVCVGMKQISDSPARPYVFRVGRGDGGSWLSYAWAEPADWWSAGDQFVFRLRKKPLKP